MRKIAVLVMAGIGLILGTGAVAGADPYPVDDESLVLSSSTVAPGGTFSVTLNGCTDGEEVVFTVSGDSDTATCVGGSATGTLTAPTAPGTYTVTATSPTASATATLTVVAADDDDDDGDDGDELPATGSDSAPIAQLAGGALLAGIGLVGVAWYRRRATA
jgi:LPXTG-motif cell wall-anchored protein